MRLTTTTASGSVAERFAMSTTSSIGERLTMIAAPDTIAQRLTMTAAPGSITER